MNTLYQRCCGLDIHLRFVVATVLLIQDDETQYRMTRTFATDTASLLALLDWLESLKVSHVAMESTGVYWRPIFNLFEDHFTLILANAHQTRSLPGHKTDVKDSEWIAQLLQHGLLRPSFVPRKEIRVVRDYVRERKAIVQMRNQEINRLHATLETANITLSGVVTDLLGKSGRAMLRAMIEGVTDPDALAKLARGSLRKKLPQLREALTGTLAPLQARLIAHHLDLITYCEQQIEQLLHEIEEQLAPKSEIIALMVQVPGIQHLSAMSLLAEWGDDLSSFADDKHFASWLGVCPGNHRSAKRSKGGKPSPGNRHVQAILAECVMALLREKKKTFLSAQYYRLRQRIGHQKALVAVSHRLAVILYHVIKEKAVYQELGPDDGRKENPERVKERHLKALRAMGYEVTLQEREEGA